MRNQTFSTLLKTIVKSIYGKLYEIPNILKFIDIIKEKEVFTKIPKNSVQIPDVGDYTYSPDFAYVVEF